MKIEQADQKKYIIAGGLMLLCTFFWGSAFAVIRILLKYFHGNPLYLLASRFIPTGIFFLAYILISARKQIRFAVQKDWKLLLGSAFFGIIVYHLSINLAETVVRGDQASLVISLLPLMTVLTASAVYKEKASLIVWAGALLSLSGVYIMMKFTIPGEQIKIGTFPLPMILGHILIFICPITMVFYTFISRPLAAKYSPAISIGAGFVIALLPMFAFIDRGLLDIVFNAPVDFWLALVFLVGGSTISGYLLWIVSLKLTNPSYVNLFIYLNPVWGVLVNHLLFPAEELNTGMIMGGLLILTGVIIGTDRVKIRLNRKPITQ